MSNKISLKNLALDFKAKGKFSIVHDFFGYRTGKFFNHSIREQIKLFSGKYIDINIIYAGVESFDQEDKEKIDMGVSSARFVFAAVNLGIRKINYFSIAMADYKNHGGLDTITRYVVTQNDALDAFFVPDDIPSEDDITGDSPTNGFCTKSENWGHGVRVEKKSVGQTILAHEIGHYLGLPHSSLFKNLMNVGEGQGGIDLTENQGKIVRNHCLVKSG